MSQTTVFALGTTAGSSSPVVIATGAVGSFGLFTDSAAGIKANEGVAIYIDTPGQDQKFAVLDLKNPTASIQGPAEVIFKRLGVSTVNLGVVQYG
ncbi:MAG TPA: hypothetical protein VIS29_14210 [Streptomyces sp.]|jgi:hypothetical protein